MDEVQIKKIAREVIKKHYPNMTGIEPDVEIMDTGIPDSSFKKTDMTPIPGKKIWIATFTKEEITEEGLPITRTTKVTMDESGNVIKISESK